MPSNFELLILVGSPLILAGFGYAAYWALGIRRALAVRLYRNQALGIGLMSLLIFEILFSFALVVIFNWTQFTAGVFTPLIAVWQLGILAFNVLLFFQIDTSVLAARKSDPLLRDAFSWQRTRFFLWPLYLGLLVFSYVGGPIGIGNPAAIPLWLFVTLFAGGVVLPVAASRSRDVSLRNNLKMLAIAIVVFFVSFTPEGLTSDVFLFTSVSYPLYFLVAYLFYRSARSLAPLNRVEPLTDLASRLKVSGALNPRLPPLAMLDIRMFRLVVD